MNVRFRTTNFRTTNFWNNECSEPLDTTCPETVIPILLNGVNLSLETWKLRIEVSDKQISDNEFTDNECSEPLDTKYLETVLPFLLNGVNLSWEAWKLRIEIPGI